MTHDDALAALAADPHVARYRALCADDADPARRDAYRALVVRLARGDRTSPPPPAADPAYLERLPPLFGGCCGGGGR